MWPKTKIMPIELKTNGVDSSYLGNKRLKKKVEKNLTYLKKKYFSLYLKKLKYWNIEILKFRDINQELSVGI